MDRVVSVASDSDRRSAADPAALFAGLYAGRRVLVTGDTGFKGSWRCTWLADLGATVGGYAWRRRPTPVFELIAVRGEVAHIVGDVRDLAALSAAVAQWRPEVVFHLAAQPLVRPSYGDPRDTFETNVMGVVNLFEAVRACPSVRGVVNVTSDKCYENNETARAYREADPLGGHDPYSASKGCAEMRSCGLPAQLLWHGLCGACGDGARRQRHRGWRLGPDRLVPDCVRAIVAWGRGGRASSERCQPCSTSWSRCPAIWWLGARLLRDGHRFDGAWNFGPKDAAAMTVGEIVPGVRRGLRRGFVARRSARGPVCRRDTPRGASAAARLREEPRRAGLDTRLGCADGHPQDGCLVQGLGCRRGPSGGGGRRSWRGRCEQWGRSDGSACRRRGRYRVVCPGRRGALGLPWAGAAATTVDGGAL